MFSNPLLYAVDFYIDEKLTEEICIPDGVTMIGAVAFRNYHKLTSISIPDRVTTIGEKAFAQCTSLTSVTIPSSVTTLDYYAFYYCTSLTHVHFLGDMPV